MTAVVDVRLRLSAVVVCDEGEAQAVRERIQALLDPLAALLEEYRADIHPEIELEAKVRAVGAEEGVTGS